MHEVQGGFCKSVNLWIMQKSQERKNNKTGNSLDNRENRSAGKKTTRAESAGPMEGKGGTGGFLTMGLAHLQRRPAWGARPCATEGSHWAGAEVTKARALGRRARSTRSTGEGEAAQVCAVGRGTWRGQRERDLALEKRASRGGTRDLSLAVVVREAGWR